MSFCPRVMITSDAEMNLPFPPPGKTAKSVFPTNALEWQIMISSTAQINLYNVTNGGIITVATGFNANTAPCHYFACGINQ